MARIRTIKPDFYSSGKQLRLSIEAAFLLPCLWVNADDEGRMVDDDLEIGARCPRLMGKIEGLLFELSDKKWIDRYEVGEKKYIQIHDWKHHQSIDRPKPSRVPTPEGSTMNRRAVDDESMGIGREGKGKEGKGRESEGRETVDNFGGGEGQPFKGLPLPSKKNITEERERQIGEARKLGIIQ